MCNSNVFASNRTEQTVEINVRLNKVQKVKKNQKIVIFVGEINRRVQVKIAQRHETSEIFHYFLFVAVQLQINIKFSFNLSENVISCDCTYILFF